MKEMPTPAKDGEHHPDVTIISSESDEEVEQDQMSSSILRRTITQGSSAVYSQISSTYIKSPMPSCSSKVVHEDESATCPICLDPWTNLGAHRLCALKCGHLFGFNCISKWMAILKRSRCPTCKEKAALDEIRNIYARKLVAVDVTKIEELTYKITEILKERNAFKLDFTKSFGREQMLVCAVEELETKVQLLSSALERRPELGRDSIIMRKMKSLEVCQAKGCRVFSYYKNDNLIVVSKQAPNTTFPEYGAQNVDVATFTPTSYIPLHSKAIRDLRFHSEKPWLLSVSFDKTFKIFDANSNKVITTARNSNNLPLWSCCWDTNDPNCFLVGEQGPVSKFDLRRVDQAVDTYISPNNDSPVVSIATITAGSRGPFTEGGIISCNLNSLQVFNNKPSQHCTRHSLPFNPPFMHTTYDNERHLMLVSTRPTSKVPHTRHHVGKLVLDDLFDDTLNVDLSCCLQGSPTSTFLSRSCLWAHEGGGFAAAYQESARMMYVWSTDTGKRVSVVTAEDPIVDLCSVNARSSTYVFSLSQSAIDCFRLE